MNTFTPYAFMAAANRGFGDGSDGVALLTENTSWANNDNGFIVKQYRSLTVDEGVLVTASQASEGMFVFVQEDCVINGELSMSKMGSSGDSGTDLMLSDLTAFTDYAGSLLNFKVPVSGAEGGAQTSTQINGYDGTAGMAGATGGGGAGGVNPYGTYDGSPTGWGGAGARGTSRAGGPGGGGGGGPDNNRTAGGCGSAAIVGGAGGRGADTGHTVGMGGGGGGAGLPAGGAGAHKSYYCTCIASASGETGLGGILWLIVGGELFVGQNGSISADGASGGKGSDCCASDYDYSGGGGGGSGGGSIHVLHKRALNNIGTIHANGGSGGIHGEMGSPYYYGKATNGGSGGAGSVIVAQIESWS